MTRRRPWRLVAAALLVAGCSQTEAAAPAVAPLAAADLQLIDRLTWGINATEIARFRRLGRAGWIEHQFREPAPLTLPGPVQARLEAMEVARVPMERLATAAEALRYAGTHGTDKPARAASYMRFATETKALQRETVERSLLRDLYSPDQLREQLTWFWFNHFNVRIAQQPLATMVRDYEELTIRPRALGKFCDLVGATLRHPAMLIYLNNTANRADRINENHARELMELHTMGVGSGYSQADVKTLARVLTGARADLVTWPIPAGAPARGTRRGIYVFDPGRHDGGAKTLLGRRLTARGEGEITEATGMLCRHPATARRISKRLAQFFVADAPAPALVDAMAATFVASDGDIAAVMRTLIAHPVFAASLGTLYKDPQHYLLSAVRLAYDDRVIARPAALNAMLATLGQARFARLTPDGYPLEAAEWSSSGQLANRFGMASAIGRGAVRLFTPEGAIPERGVPPELQALVTATGIDAPFAAETRTALAAARAPGEWNSLYLASPEFMRR